MLDNAIELVVRNGRDVRHALTMFVPPAWQSDAELPAEVRDFYRYHAGLVEPWDGPAALVFTDGRVVGACLDRNGLRPLRLSVSADGLVVCSSEAGVADFDGRGEVWRTKLGPGQIVAVDPKCGLELDGEIKERLAAQRPYGAWLAASRVALSTGEPLAAAGDDVTMRQALHGWTREDILTCVRPTATAGHEPTSSMGDDTALPPLANRPRPLTSYFRQRFAQVTNPPIDHLRERNAMSIATLLGGRAPLLVDGPAAAGGYELESFLVYPDALAELPAHWLETTFDPACGLEAACRELAEQAVALTGEGVTIVLSDASASADRLPIPSLLALGYVHHHLVARGLRTRATLVVDCGDAREVHDVACLLGYGAEAICPRLALETVAALAGRRQARRRPPVARRGAAPAGRRARGGRPEGPLEDGDLGGGELLRRADLRGDRPRP
jgi:hypothetical protein